MFESFSKSVSKFADEASKQGQCAMINAEKGFYVEQIKGIKNKFGNESFNDALVGNSAAVQQRALEAKRLIEPLEAKIRALDEKKLAVSPLVVSGGAPPPKQKLSMTVPLGCIAGSSFQAQSPDGTMFIVQVPAGVVPGQQIIVEAPIATTTPTTIATTVMDEYERAEQEAFIRNQK